MQNFIRVLDKGYVRLVDQLGTDLTVANAARVSYAKESKELVEQDKRLISFLGREGHTSPFRHAVLQFEIYAPLMVARQWWKYIIGSSHQEGAQEAMNAWNESSRRYITEDVVLHTPDSDSWRSAPENSKQGSGAPLDEVQGSELSHLLEKHQVESLELYENAIEMGVAVEQARLFLPAYGLFVRWYWTASLQSVHHFIKQRIASDAQFEIQEYARAVKSLTEDAFPVSFKALD